MNDKSFERLVGALAGEQSASELEILSTYRRELQMLEALRQNEPQAIAAPPRRRSRAKRALTITAACLALMIGISAVTFASNPALAADIPVVGDIVYELSPVVVPDESTTQRVRETVQAALENISTNGYFFSEYEEAPVGWELNRDTMLFAAYLKYQETMSRYELRKKGYSIESDDFSSTISITNIVLYQKAFKLNATVQYATELDGYTLAEGAVNVTLTDKRAGLTVTDFTCSGEDYEEYIELLKYIKGDQFDKMTPENFEDTNLAATMLVAARDMRNRYLSDDSISPQNKKLFAIVDEFWKRYYDSWWLGLEPDCSDIMERNDETEAYYSSIAHWIKVYSKHNRRNNHPMPETIIITTGLKLLFETEDTFTAEVYSRLTNSEGTTGLENHVFTFKETADGGYIIIALGVHNPSNHYYDEIETITKRSIALAGEQGISRAEANTIIREEYLKSE